MERLRVIACVLGLGIPVVAPAPAVAAPGEFSDPVLIFAACAGRLSAEMEHRWLDGRDATDITRQRAAMIDLVDAVRPEDRGIEILARRIEAKFAQAALLQRATFGTDPEEARRARALAGRARGQCLALMPG